jgi:hypothetical protein
MTQVNLQEKMSAAALKDILSFGITHVPLGDAKQWAVDTRAWMVEMYKVVNPYLIEKYPESYPRTFVCTKSTQAGITTMALVRMLHFMTHWTGRVMYMMPRQKDVLDLVGTRLDPLLKASPMLNGLRGIPDNMQTKAIGNSFVYFQEGTMEPRSIPIDLLFVDEVDLTAPENIGTATNRLDDSSWKLRYYLSTPTVNNYGIHKMWLASDMRKWLVKCPKCNKEQEIQWDQNLRMEGNPANPTSVYYGCHSCDAEITLSHMQTGRWVAERPELSDTTVGFHVHQMLTTPARVLYAQFRDPLETEVEFHRKRLGMPFELDGGSLEADDVYAGCYLDEPYEKEIRHDGESTYYMGVDQGNQLQVTVCKIIPGHEYPKVVRIELVNPDDGGFERIGNLMRFFRVKKCVIDANPNRHSAIDLATSFPGRIYIADYNESGVWYTTKPKKSGIKKYHQVYMDRTLSFDNLFTDIRNGQWGLYGDVVSLPQDIHLIVDQVTALKRDVEERTRGGIKIEVPVYRSVRADHLGHSWSYMNVAVDLGRVGVGKIAIVSAQQPDTDDDIVLGMAEETYKAILWQLAEVKKDEIKEWLYDGVEPSVVLSHKLSFLTMYDDDLIREAMEYYLLTT